MVDKSEDDALREMAQHRGLKLVKSRRRKPGVGDYGKYGLMDGSGKALLGIGDEGLTATAKDVEDYLRVSAVGTWRQSADTVPDRPPAQPARKAKPESDQINEPVKRARAAAVTGSGKAAAKVHDTGPSHKPAILSKPRPEPVSKRELAPEPEMVLRLAKPADAAALARVLSQIGGIKIDASSVAANLAAVRKAGGGMVLAEKGDLIGCCSWSVLLSIHRGRIGRISAMIVEEKHRRMGIGTRLLHAVLTELAKTKCLVVEAMSDIDLKNSHNFFRSTGFDQTSYRFVRKLD